MASVEHRSGPAIAGSAALPAGTSPCAAVTGEPGGNTATRGVRAFLEARKRLQTAQARSFLSFAMVCCTVGVDFTGVTMQAPLIPFYVEQFDDAREMGFGAANALLMTSYTLSQFVSTPVFGLASDRFGRRPLFLISLVGGSVGFLGQAFCDSLRALCALRFLTGLFGGSRPVALAYIGDTVPPEQQPKYIAGVATTVSVALFVAPVFGGSMGLLSLRLPCFFQAGLGLLVLALAYLYLEEPARSRDSTSGQRGAATAGGPRPSSRTSWKLPLAANAAVGGLAMGMVSAWQTLLPILGTRDLGLNQNEIGLIMGMSGLAVAAVQFGICIPLSRRVRLPLIGFFGVLLQAAPAAASWSSSVWQLILLAFTHAAGSALVMSGISIVVNMLSPPGLRGTVMALTITVQAASRVLFPIATGPLYDQQRWAPSVIFAGAGTLAALLELALTRRVPALGQPAAAPQLPDKQLSTSMHGDMESCAGIRSQPSDGSADREEEERQHILQSLQEIHNELQTNLQVWQGRLQELRGGEKSQRQLCEELCIPAHLEDLPEIEQSAKLELGEWLSDMLVSHNYRRWPQHMDTLKCVLKNSFPQVRMAPISTRAEDLVYLLESHLLLEQRWERFVLSRPQTWQEHMERDTSVPVLSPLGSCVYE